MMRYINYISAKYRLKEVEKTVTMLGGESEAPVEIVAQRDFIRLEKEYFGEECFKMTTWIGILILIAVFVLVPYYFMVNHGYLK